MRSMVRAALHTPELRKRPRTNPLRCSVGEQYLEEIDLFAVGQYGRVDPAAQVVAHPGRLCAAGPAAQIILSRAAQCLDLLASIHVTPSLPPPGRGRSSRMFPSLRGRGQGRVSSPQKSPLCPDCLYYTNKCSKCQEGKLNPRRASRRALSRRANGDSQRRRPRWAGR